MDMEPKDWSVADAEQWLTEQGLGPAAVDEFVDMNGDELLLVPRSELVRGVYGSLFFDTLK